LSVKKTAAPLAAKEIKLPTLQANQEFMLCVQNLISANIKI
jgi:hypothetical protein